jgi:hypothetical protein
MEKDPAGEIDLDDVSDWDFLKIMYDLFGVRRCAELVGWSVIFALSGVKDLKAMREDLEARGLSERTAYRAAADFKRLKDALEGHLRRDVTVEEVFRVVQEAASAKTGRSVV